MAATLHPRYLQQQVLDALSDTPVVCILGPRQVGKATLARQLERECIYVSFDDSTMLAAARYDPPRIVAGLPEKVILDEVQPQRYHRHSMQNQEAHATITVPGSVLLYLKTSSKNANPA